MKISKKLLVMVLAVIIAFSAIVPAFAADEKLNYVVLGDSIGYGAGVLNSDEACFGKIVADTAGFNFKNDAVNGYRTEDLINHLDKENIKADVAAADIISISIGGNDFLRGDMAGLIKEASAGDFSRFDAIADEFYANFCVIIQKIKILNPDAVILMQTLYNPGFEAIRDVYQQGADRLNAGYAKYLKANPGAYELLEVAEAFSGHSEYIAADYIHPSAEGNVVIAKIVLSKLCELKLTDKTEPVVKHEGIDQKEFISFKYLRYLIRKALSMISDYFSQFIKNIIK